MIAPLSSTGGERLAPEATSPANSSATSLGGVPVNLAGALVFGLSGFVFAVLLTNGVGAAEAGRFWTALALFNIISRASELGTASGLIRLISVSGAEGDLGRVRTTLRPALLPVVAAGLAGSLVLVAAAGTMFATDGTANPLLLALAPFVIVNALYTALVNGLRGFGSMVPNVAVDRLARGLIQPAGALVCVALDLPLYLAAVSWGLTAFALLGVTSGLLWARIRAAAPTVLDRASCSREFWVFTRPRIVGQICDVSILWADVLLIGLLLDDRSTGIYVAVSRFAIVAMFVAEAIMKVVGPRTAQLVSAGHTGQVNGLLHRAARAQTAIIWPVYLVLAVHAPAVVRLFGDDLDEGATVLRVLCVGVLVAALHGPIGSVVLMAGRSRDSRRASVVSLVANIGLNVVLLPVMGITGAAVAWAASFVLSARINARSGRAAGFEVGLGGSLRVAGRSLALSGTVAVAALVLVGDPLVAVVVASVVGGLDIMAELLHLRSDLADGRDTDASGDATAPPTLHPQIQ